MEKNKGNIPEKELIIELQECREDERNSKNHIVQTMSTAVTGLGILFGTSFINVGSWSGDKYIRAIFLICLIVFCATYSYIITIGIENTIRHHYIKDIEYRLLKNKKDIEEGSSYDRFIHWKQYSSKIITLNIKHIGSYYTLGHYIYLMLAIFLCLLFCVSILAILFLRIEKKSWFDYTILLLAFMLSLFTFIFFLVINRDAKKIVRYARSRFDADKYKNAYGALKKKVLYFLQYIGYLVYPKTQDLQKPLLIVLGYFVTALSTGNMNSYTLFRLYIYLFIFEVLAYQARYQINDIRGIDCDNEMGYKHRLPLPQVKIMSFNDTLAIDTSYRMALIRVFMAILCTCFLPERDRLVLGIHLLLLLAFTIFYEMARNDEKNKKIKCFFVFLLVGSGYSLRISLGIYAAGGFYAGNIQFWIVCIAMWLCGIFASTLVWIDEICDSLSKKGQTILFTKKHYNYLKDKLKILKKGSNIERNMMRDDGGFKYFLCFWNDCFILSIVLLVLITLISRPGGLSNASVLLVLLYIMLVIVMVVETGTFLCFIILFTLVFIVTLMILDCFYSDNMIYLLSYVLQIIVIITYGWLRVQFQISKLDMRKIMRRIVTMRNGLKRMITGR